jgi:hypothetical protein
LNVPLWPIVAVRHKFPLAIGILLRIIEAFLVPVVILHIAIEYGAFRNVLIALWNPLPAPDAAVVFAGNRPSFR